MARKKWVEIPNQLNFQNGSWFGGYNDENVRHSYMLRKEEEKAKSKLLSKNLSLKR